MLRDHLVNMLTFDVEDWYHPLDPECAHWPRYEDRIGTGLQVILDLLDAAGTRATFFTLGEVARRHPGLVRDIHARGHEVASHGMWHRPVYSQTAQAFEADVRESLDVIGSIVGSAITGYRAPYFSVTAQSRWALPILRDLGIRYDSSIFPVLNHRYGIPDAPRLPYEVVPGLIEVPPSTWRAAGQNVPIAGGVYFRVYPYHLTRLLFRQLQARAEPIVFYLHPWELDPGHPRLKVARTLSVRHYWGLARTAGKLQALLREFRFGPVCDALENTGAVSRRTLLQ